MDAEDRLVLKIRRIINDGKESLKSSPVKLSVRRRTIADINNAIELDDISSITIFNIKSALNYNTAKPGETELTTLSNKIGKIDSIINNYYTVTRLVKLHQWIDNRLSQACRDSPLSIHVNINMIHNSMLRINTVIEVNELLHQFIESHTDENGRIFPNITICGVGVKNPIILEAYNSVVGLDRNTAIKSVNEVINMQFDSSTLSDDWIVTVRLDDSGPQIRIITTIELR